MLGLPYCFALKSTRHAESYLRYVHDDREEKAYRQLQLDGKDAGNPFTRFDSEPSLLHQGMVHIRCRYNRKYWVTRQLGGRWSVVADAHEPEEDLDSANCTLIKPMITISAKDADDVATSEAVNVITVRFLHAGTAQPGKDTRMSFSMGDGGDAFTVVNLAASPRRLPTYVVFKGDNDLYLRSVTINGLNYPQFSASDVGEPTVAHEISYLEGPSYQGRAFAVRSIHLNGFWLIHHHGNQWMLAYSTPPQTGLPTAWTDLKSVDVGDYFAISPSMYLPGVDSFFARDTTSGTFANCLGINTQATTITAQARIRVEEPVLDREIYNVDYRLMDARIHDTSVLTMATTSAVNDTSRDNTQRLTLAYQESEMSTWDATLELKLGYQSRLRAGFPRLGLGATVNISAEFFGAYNWGETMEKNVSHEVEYEVTVPPNTKVTVSLIATRSAVDVPFNYWQRDVMSMDGQAREVYMTDGLFTGINSYNFQFHTTEEKLKERRLAPTPTLTPP